MKNHTNPDHTNPDHTTLRLSKSLKTQRENECHGKTARGSFHTYGGVAASTASTVHHPGRVRQLPGSTGSCVHLMTITKGERNEYRNR